MGIYIYKGKTKLLASYIDCSFCGDEFLKPNNEIRKSKKHYCNKNCMYSDRRKPPIAKKCDNCNITFSRKSNEFRGSKSGLYFCSVGCKNKAQRIGGIQHLIPDHYGNGESDYRGRAFDAYPCKCVDCDFDIRMLLEVHHKDGDKNNNKISNLEILCPIHHKIRHCSLTDNGWAYNTSYLTPLVCIPILRNIIN